MPDLKKFVEISLESQPLTLHLGVLGSNPGPTRRDFIEKISFDLSQLSLIATSSEIRRKVLTDYKIDVGEHQPRSIDIGGGRRVSGRGDAPFPGLRRQKFPFELPFCRKKCFAWNDAFQLFFGLQNGRKNVKILLQQQQKLLYKVEVFLKKVTTTWNPWNSQSCLSTLSHFVPWQVVHYGYISIACPL